MRAVVQPVIGRAKTYENFYATRDDFELGPSEESTVDRLLNEPGWAPYCIDAERRSVCFIRMREGIDLHTAPFAFVTEFREATHFMAVGFDDVAQLVTPLPDPKVILVFSMGRCGTTLLSHALNGPDGVAGLSEPPIFEHRPLRALAEREGTSRLIRDCCRLLFAMRTKRDADTLAIKFRSQALFIAEQFWKALPDARYVYMYRDAVGWGNSFMHFLDSIGAGVPADLDELSFHWMMVSADQPIAHLARFIPIDRPPADAGAILAPGWVIHMEEYERLRKKGVPLAALRYNELLADREGELGRLFDHCGVSRAGIAAALLAFDHDSQEGTAIARAEKPKRFTPEEHTTYLATLAKVPEWANPDVIVSDVNAT